ncbi:MAG: DUF2914 domain-containing protein [Candidatus Paceibacterota bacterium]|jgi:hypothetical protein
MFFQKIQRWFERYERHISSVGLPGGIVFTWFAVSEIDGFREHEWIIGYLILTFLSIIVINAIEQRAISKRSSWMRKLHFVLLLVVQFSFGALFSTFFVFYARSSSLFVSWPFILLIAVVLISNELIRQHYARVSVQIITLFLAIYLYMIFLVPVVVHRMGDDVFIASGIASLVVLYGFLFILRIIFGNKLSASRPYITLFIIIILCGINALYFTKLIPPIPLSLSSIGVYHDLRQIGGNTFVGKKEPITFVSYMKTGEIFHRVNNESVYVWAVIFSPTEFATQVVHKWYYFNVKQNEWILTNRITLPMTYSKGNGYKTYSLKEATFPGLWRVSVETLDGQVLGQIKFTIEKISSSPKLVEEKL